MEAKKPFKFEFSAGGIVFKKEDGSIFILLTQHSQHRGWSFPKGWIEKGESKEETALREVKEEGGVEAKIVSEAPPAEYFFVSEEARVKKKVYYYLMEYLSGDPKDHDWEMIDAAWIPLDEVSDKLTFKSDKEVFGKALDQLKA